MEKENKILQKTYSTNYDYLKWIAIVSMFLDHLRFASEDLAWTVYAGRMAFPIFAVLCGANAAFHTRSIKNFSYRILFLAFVCEFLELAILSALEFNYSIKAGPVFTLFLGVFLCFLFSVKSKWILLAIPAIVLSDDYLSYGCMGAFLTLAAYVFLKTPSMLTSLFFAISAMGPNLGVLPLMVISFPSAITAIILIQYAPPLPKIPTIRGRILYLAFPLSFIPPLLIGLFLK